MNQRPFRSDTPRAEFIVGILCSALLVRPLHDSCLPGHDLLGFVRK